jgi:uncharacterized protein
VALAATAVVRGPLAAALLLLPAAAGARLPVPPLSGPVVDQAGILDAASERRLEALARGAREAPGGGVQLQFLTVRSLEGEPIEDYSIRVAEAWRLGGAERDDGLLVTLAVEERAVRIEVGGGLEGGLTDAQASRILRGTIAPAFQAGRFGDGLYEAGVQALAALGALPADVARRQAQPHPRARFPVLGIVILFVVFSVLRSFTGFGRRRRRHLWWGGGPWIGGGGGTFGGGLGGGGGGWSGGGGGFSGGGASGRW